MAQTYTLSDLKYIKPSTLRTWFRGGASPHGSGKFAIIDVRDTDYIGGHIKGSHNYPACNLLRTIPKLHAQLYREKVDDVVFHCMLSQARGPSAALKFLRSLNKIDDPVVKEYFKGVHVYVLKGGFQRWAREYGDDSNVTEDLAADLWK
ncbi:CDC25-like phosphatase YCH1 [Spathaspora sp. JA1]|nr:CDC25-like phosphatase YCH1 [Spathaspora sp. JA1]